MAIAKISRPGRARATVTYLLGAQDHLGRPRGTVSVVASTIGRTPTLAIGFLGALSRLRPRLKRHLYHVSISVPACERELARHEWAALGRAWCTEMGVENYMIVLHDDHIHIVASRIRFDGTAAPDSFDFRRSETVLRQLESRFDLLPTASSHLLERRGRAQHRRARTLPELHAILREGGSDKDRIRRAIDAALAKAPNAAQLGEALASSGIDMTLHEASDGAGYVLFGFRGRQYGPRALGQGYSLSHLVKRGLQRSGPEDPPAQLPSPPWRGEEAPRISTPPFPRNHAAAVRQLKSLGRDAQEVIKRFRQRGGADLGLIDPDLYGPGEDTDEAPDL